MPARPGRWPDASTARPSSGACSPCSVPRSGSLSWGTNSDSPTAFFWKGQLAASPGTYRIVFTDDEDTPLLERTVAVPNGRSATVPVVS